MKGPASGLALSFLLLHISTNAQDNKAPRDDSSAIRATIRNYIEGYYTGDAARMERSLHPHYLKHMIHGDIPTREKSGRERVEEIRSHGPLTFPRQSRRSRSVGWIFRETALLRNSSRRTGVDYMTLSKLDGQWRNLSLCSGSTIRRVSSQRRGWCFYRTSHSVAACACTRSSL
jgi:hypothetical protein